VLGTVDTQSRLINDYNQWMRELIDEIIYSNRKTIAIEVKPGGRVIVRAPKGTRRANIEQFVHKKSGWILQAKARLAAVPAENPNQQFHNGADVLYLGKVWRLIHTPKVTRGLVFDPRQGFLLQEGRLEAAPGFLKGFYREETRRLVKVYIEKHADRWGLIPTSVRITSAMTRWGSCSGKNGLNFSYRLAMLPLEAIEYVVVHELAHIRHHNHSAAFWNYLGQMLPDYQQRRQWLKQNGRKLPQV